MRIAGVCERDVDLLLLEEFISSLGFATWFFAAATGEELDIVEIADARRSVTHSHGESDLQVLLLDSSGDIHGLLVENKVGADVQPQQAERYRARGDDLVREGVCSDVLTVLVAPESYFGPERDLHAFDAGVTYESVRDWFGSQNGLGPRRDYKTQLLTSAIEKSRFGYQPVEDSAVSEFWHSYWELAVRVAPRLQMREPGSKPASAGFIRFTPLGFPGDVCIIHKLPYGFVDLQFAGMGDRVAELVERFSGRLAEGMKVVKASKSGAVRLEVAGLNTAEPFDSQRADVDKALDAALALAEWFLDSDGGW